MAVLDTGVQLDHPDLRDALWTNEGEIPWNGIDDDGNGFIDDVHGYDFAGVQLSSQGESHGNLSSSNHLQPFSALSESALASKFATAR